MTHAPSVASTGQRFRESPSKQSVSSTNKNRQQRAQFLKPFTLKSSFQPSEVKPSRSAETIIRVRREQRSCPPIRATHDSSQQPRALWEREHGGSSPSPLGKRILPASKASESCPSRKPRVVPHPGSPKGPPKPQPPAGAPGDMNRAFLGCHHLRRSCQGSAGPMCRVFQGKARKAYQVL